VILPTDKQLEISGDNDYVDSGDVDECVADAGTVAAYDELISYQ